MHWRVLLLWRVRLSNGKFMDVICDLGGKTDEFYLSRLRDQMGLIEESSEMDTLCSSVKDCGGVYFVTAFSGLLAPYWDPNAVGMTISQSLHQSDILPLLQSGMIIGLTQYSTASHIARAVLEAACYQTRAVLDVIEKESGVKLEVLKVDGGVTNSDLAMQLQADIGGFKVCRPQMRE
jgi:glycerol kinase